MIQLPPLTVDDLQQLSVRTRDTLLTYFIVTGKISNADRDNILNELKQLERSGGDYRFFNGLGTLALKYDEPCYRCYPTSHKMIAPDEYRLVFFPIDPNKIKPEHYCLSCISEKDIAALNPVYRRKLYKVANEAGITMLSDESVDNVKNYLNNLRNRGVTKVAISSIATLAKIDSKSCGWARVKKVLNDCGWFRKTKQGCHVAIKRNKKVVAAYADHYPLDPKEIKVETTTEEA